MSKPTLDRLAEVYGIQLSYLSEKGKRCAPSDAAKRAVLEAMGVAAGDPGSLSRSLATAPEPADAALAAPPGVRCFLPEWLVKGRAWGITCQLYGLRSARNHGIGDFEDLARLAERTGGEGADFLGVNPLHALFTADPERCSPFSPSNRGFLNPLYIAIDRIPGIDAPAAVDPAACARLRTTAQVDYGAVGALKLGVLRAVWKRIVEAPSLWDAASRRDFETFVAAGGAALLAHARFEALSHRMTAEGRGAGWRSWPEAYRSATGADVERFAAENRGEIDFHLWLQWIADAQLGAAAARARAAGMRIGLYLDFAVGTAPDGSATWSDPELVVPGANIGAPPDAFFAGGQDWGLAPMSPAVLRARGFAPYRDMLDSAMRHAGAVRLDHAMSVYRLFWIPHGMPPQEGCYVQYPLADMLRSLAGVSTARRAIVIGEDLGTVPEGFRELMQGADMLSCRLLYFEQTKRGFRAPASYRRNAFLSVSSHDLPPLASWWTGNDIALFQTLGQLDAAGAGKRRKERDRDRRSLIARLGREAARRRFTVPAPADDEAERSRLTPDLVVAVHAYLARTPSRLLGVQFEDLCGAVAPVNVPGTSAEYPNWRLRAPAALEDVTDSGLWRAIVAAVARERPRSA
ncbi:MAG: 4-alpha-glucanotransferase [Alphaproteobacteria bacterium]|nr:4-alpha-glucanotransferase [Alphaproteobacteria bacterium]